MKRSSTFGMDARRSKPIQRDLSRRCIAGLIPLTVITVTLLPPGCAPHMQQQEPLWQPQHDRERVARQQPFNEPTAERSPWSDDSAPAESSPRRANEARDQVLAFINRLENMRESEAAVEPTSPRDFDNPPADGPLTTGNRPEFDGSFHSTRKLSQQSRESEHSSPPREATPPRRTAMAPATIQPPAQDLVQPPRVVSVAIRQRSSFEPASPETTAQVEISRKSEAQVANRPIATEQVTPEIDALKLAVERAERRVEDLPGDLDALWHLALLRLSTGWDAAELEAPADMSEQDAALFHHALATMSAAREALEEPVTGVEEALTATEALRRALKPRAELRVPTVALCSRVNAFGVYEQLPEGALREGVHNQAIVYFEIENFASQETEDGRYRSVIRDRFEVMSLDGALLWEHEEPNIEDVSRSHREDFFVAQRITLPPSLEGGDYVLKVTVEDLLADKRTQAIHEFTIQGPRRTAGK